MNRSRNAANTITLTRTQARCRHAHIAKWCDGKLSVVGRQSVNSISNRNSQMPLWHKNRLENNSHERNSSKQQASKKYTRSWAILFAACTHTRTKRNIVALEHIRNELNVKRTSTQHDTATHTHLHKQTSITSLMNQTSRCAHAYARCRLYPCAT